MTAPWRGRWAGGAVRSGGSGLIRSFIVCLDHMRTCQHAAHLPGGSSSSVGSRGATTAPSPALQAPPNMRCARRTPVNTQIYTRNTIRPGAPRPPLGPAETQTAPRARGRACLQYMVRAYTVHGACLARRGSRARTRDHTETDATRPRADGAWRLAPRGRGARQRPAGPAGIRDAPRRHGGAMGRDRGGGCRTPDLRSDVPRPTDAVGCAG